MIQPTCDSDEECFMGPPTPREVHLLKQRHHLFPATAEASNGTEVAQAQEEDKNVAESTEEKKVLTREDFDCTLDFFEYQLEIEDGLRGDSSARPAASSGNEIREPPAGSDPQEEPETPAEGRTSSQSHNRPPTPIPEPPIVWGPYSPITPTGSSATPQRPSADAGTDAEMPEAAGTDAEMPEVAETPYHHLVSRGAVENRPPVAKPRKQAPSNIRFATGPTTKAASERRPPASERIPIRPPTFKPKPSSAIRSKAVESPVRKYRMGVVDAHERTMTPLTENKTPRVVPCTTPIAPRAAEEGSEPPRSSSKKNKFPNLMDKDLGSAGRIVVPSGPGASNRVLNKIGRIPVEKDGQTLEYSVYESE